jgi:23S rRNA pseudouridine1911/1915/1917 synthase
LVIHSDRIREKLVPYLNFRGLFDYRFTQESKTRLDVFLSSLSAAVSRSFWIRALQKGWIQVNGKSFKKSYTLKIGDRICFDYYEIVRTLEGQDLRIEIPYRILADTKEFVVVDKPDGVLTHRIGFLDHSVLSQVAHDLKTPLFTVHRLDKYTSGVCLFAKSSSSAHQLQELLRCQGFEKYYLVASEKRLAASSGVFTQPIGEDDPRIHKKKRCVDFENGLFARTRYRYFRGDQGLHYYLVRIFTGRQHQIRVHFQYAGASVANDELYSYDDYSDFPPLYAYNEQDLGLHALRLRLVSPFTGERLCFTSWPRRKPF